MLFVISTLGEEKMGERLQGKTALVTGSGQNIGRAVAELFAAEGASVIVNGSSNRDNVDAVVNAICDVGGKAHGVMADVSDPSQWQVMLAEAEEVFGTVDILVNNVGVRHRMAFEEITPEMWQQVINTNLSSCFYGSRLVLPKMREKKWGRIINMSGYDGFFGQFYERAANVTAKAGMHGLSKAIAREYGVHEVTANTIAVGAIDTKRDQKHYAHVDIDQVFKNLSIKHPGHVNDIAEAALYLAADSGKFVTGQVIHVNGGEYMV
ncbi:SDR family oxidoreductase [Maricurvus nonylphenolicus]